MSTLTNGSSSANLSRAIRPAVNGWNADYLDSQYQDFKSDPQSVPPDVRAFFQGYDLGSTGAQAAPLAGVASPFQSAVDELIAAYRELGHLAANVDPFDRPRQRPGALAIETYGLTKADLDKKAEVALSGLSSSATLAQVVAHLEDTYCRSVGVEFMHIQNATERQWFLEKFEQTRGVVAFTANEKKDVLEDLAKGEIFEAFHAKRYGSEKRFSLEGGISLIPLMAFSIDRGAQLGVKEFVIGMAHRGRLNVLINIMGKTYAQVFTEFEDNWEAGFADGGGDVKYHRGYSGVRSTHSGGSVHLTMQSNPSHLESVNGVVIGRTRSKQYLKNDEQRTQVVPVLIHGDGALPGQGVVAECLNMSQLEGYKVGGTIHIVINNLIAFTTLPEDGRSTIYCTDIAKSIDAPIFHVNGEDPEACAAVARLAIEYRQTFKKDVFIDMWCYRKYGHNESDEQSFTQPVLASMIKSKQSTLTQYTQKLLDKGVIVESQAKEIAERLDASLDAAQAAAKKEPHGPMIDPGSERWKGIVGKFSFEPANTAVSVETLKEVCTALGSVPEGFNLNPKLKALLEERAALPNGGNVSWAHGELLAFGTLLLEGIPVRLSGQDSRRGTFTQRHSVLRDTNTGEPYTGLNQMRSMADPALPLGQMGPDGRTAQARLAVFDSPLSEYSVMGFDYGYSMADPNMLVLWEGQFGDFCNGAQIIIDQYIASSEIKWSRWSGLVLLLPHGYEGAGPEHSSARLERFLQLCADDNMQVVYPTTGAQIFHALRRQVKRNFRKPLIVMSPKSLLRTPTSPVEDLVKGTFQELIDDPAFEGKDAWDRKGVKKVVFSCGKVYFDLVERRKALGKKDIALVRIEQIYPFHVEMAKGILAKYPAKVELAFAQEEPRNAGAYIFVADQFRESLNLNLKYIGRAPSATPAVGSKRADKYQQESVIAAAIGAKPKA